jgi:hypothetical protein
LDNLSEIIVENTEQLMKLLEKGGENRAIGRTDMNEHSSRSHAIFTIYIEKRVKMNSKDKKY